MSQGVLYVEVLPSTRGIQKSVEGDLNKGFQGAEKTGSSFWGKMGSLAKGFTVAAGASFALIAGLSVKGGISRALNIEDAQAKLKGLGNDTQTVEAIMTDALAAVKGTAFGLDTAATVAASAVAAGIKPGQELERYLRLTADAATIAGISMDEMGAIINKVTAKGRAGMENLNQLTERGIPIMQWLADEYGVTADELEKMVSRGEVDATTFRKVIEENIGGAALASGNTTRGAFANMMAALSRLGLVFVEDGVGGAKTFFNEVTIILDGLADRFRPWVDSIQGMIGEAFNPAGMGERFLSGFDSLVAAVQSGPIPQLLSAFAPLLPVLAEAAKVIGATLGDAFYELGEALAPILPMIAESLVDAVVELAPPLTDLLVALIPLIPPIVDLAAALVPLIAQLVEGLVPALVWVVEQLVPVVDMLKEFFDFIAGNSTLDEFNSKLASIGGPLGDLFAWMERYNQGFTDFGTAIGEFIAGLAEFFTSGMETVKGIFASTWATIGLSLGGALQVIWGLVTGNMELVKTGISQGLNAISGWWNNIWAGISGTLGGVWSSITATVSNGISNVVSFMSSLPGRIGAAVSALPWLLSNVGQQMIQGLINGVSGMIGNAVQAVKDVGGAMLSGIQSFLGIKSPSRVFRDQVGKMIGEGLIIGVDSTSAAVDASVQHLVSIPDATDAGGGGGRGDIRQTNNFYESKTDVRVLLREAGRELKAAGV